jgi:hypothetical protein
VASASAAGAGSGGEGSAADGARALYVGGAAALGLVYVAGGDEADAEVLSAGRFKRWLDTQLHEARLRLLSDGRRYAGQQRDGQPHGTGTLTYRAGSSPFHRLVAPGNTPGSTLEQYEGEWFQGRRHGRGRSVRGDGAVYVGSWLHNQASGSGTLTYANGDRYEGEWAEDLPNGVGTARHGDWRYSGSWRMGSFHGRGAVIDATGAGYDGFWRHGRYHGTGTLRYASGASLEGNFMNGRPHGRLRFSYADGSVEWLVYHEGVLQDADAHSAVSFGLGRLGLTAGCPH